MAASALNGFSSTASQVESAGRVCRRRRMTPQSARALQKLGHAIEYLTDEFVSSGQSYALNNDLLEAVRLLMALNRQVFLECPELPTWNERLRAALRLAP